MQKPGRALQLKKVIGRNNKKQQQKKKTHTKLSLEFTKKNF